MNQNFGFGNVQFVPGVGFVQDNGGKAFNGLGDESAVMMISGMGDTVSQSRSVLSAATPGNLLRTPYKVFGIELPMWIWLLVAAGVAVGGYYWLKKERLL